MGMCIWANRQADKEVCTGYYVVVKGDVSPALDSVVRRGIEIEMAEYPEQVTGVPLRRLNIKRIRDHFQRMSNFERVDVMIDAQGKLMFEIVPLIPVMRIFTGNKSYYINAAGKHIEATPEFSADVPVVTGKFAGGFSPRYLLPVIRVIREDEMMRNLVSMVEVCDSNNILLVPRIHGHVINFGDTTRLGEKVHNLKLFYRKVIPNKGWLEYDTISVKFRHQVVASRRVKPVAPQPQADTTSNELEEATLPTIERDGE